MRLNSAGGDMPERHDGDGGGGDRLVAEVGGCQRHGLAFMVVYACV